MIAGIDRAIPDDNFDKFVSDFAHRVASFDKYAISEAKRFVNKRSGFPTEEEQHEDWDAAVRAVEQPVVQARTTKIIEMGLQKDLTFEINLDQEILKLTGEGPWDV